MSPGLVKGANEISGAGSAVTSDVKQNTVVVGKPTSYIRHVGKIV